MEFRDEKHRQIFQNYIRRQKHRPSAHHLAAVYLLTADKTLPCAYSSGSRRCKYGNVRRGMPAPGGLADHP